MPCYVVLEHDHPLLHWDLMLEAGDVLRTWRLAEPPQPDRTVAATATSDHRPFYLHYQGPVSGGRGHVVRWDHGIFAWQRTEPEHLVAKLDGVRLQGTIVLKHRTGDEWFLTFVEK